MDNDPFKLTPPMPIAGKHLKNLTRGEDIDTCNLLIELLEYRSRIIRIKKDLFSQDGVFGTEPVKTGEMMDWLTKQQNFVELQIKNVVIPNDEDL